MWFVVAQNARFNNPTLLPLAQRTEKAMKAVKGRRTWS